MYSVEKTDEFDKWLKKLKDNRAKARQLWEEYKKSF